MNTLFLIACVGMIAGSFLLLRISPATLASALFEHLSAGPKSLRDNIAEANGRKKKNLLRREIETARAILKATDRENRFPTVCTASLALFALGAAVSVAMGNLFLLPVLAVGLLFVPFWYVRFTAGHFKKDVAAELETALSIITTAYLRTEDIQTAVEENVAYLNPPVQGVFRNFLTRVQRVDPDVDAALAELKGSIDNEVFQEWCEALSACRHDRSLKTMLPPIVSKLSDMRIVNGELENLVAEPRREFMAMVALVLCNIPLLRFLNRDWYRTLMHTVPGQITLAVCTAAIFVSFAFVVRLTKPVEYKR